MKPETLYHTSRVLLVFMVIIFVSVLYLLLIPIKTLEVYNDPVAILNHEIKSGDRLSFLINYCKFVSIPGTLSSQLIDGVVITYEPIIINAEKGCRTSTVNTIIIPLNTPEGEYYYRFTVSYKVNILRTEQVVYYSQKFNITE